MLERPYNNKYEMIGRDEEALLSKISPIESSKSRKIPNSGYSSGVYQRI